MMKGEDCPSLVCARREGDTFFCHSVPFWAEEEAKAKTKAKVMAEAKNLVKE